MYRGTYSIVASDAERGEVGVAIQSHWLGVGATCAWALPGAGAVATQSVIEPAYGPRGLHRMARGESAPHALAALLDDDPLAEVRQVAMVDPAGGTATHTGAGCLPHAGQATAQHVSCQANMMLRETVPNAMLAAYRSARDEVLVDRLVGALEAAEREGGDVRGRQSAVLLLVPATGEPWESSFDLRVDDHEDPLGELRRLLRLRRAYALADAADQLMGAERVGEAGLLYRRAAEEAPEADELQFWAGLAVGIEDARAGAEMVARAAAVNPNWFVLLNRLPHTFAPGAQAVLAALRRR